MYVCKYVCVCVCVCTYVHMYVCTYICTCVYMFVKSLNTVVVYSQFFYCFMNMKSLTLFVHISAWKIDFIKKKKQNYIKIYDSHFESVPVLGEEMDPRVVSMDVVLA